ncbi:TonB-dependent receptor [Neptunicella marina]|uniref:TonB-dependent receptor n=1 Tax=Neptunicella marina TaxID=2125989 RepID=A0A8J6LYY7_9ALTE|nr:TonB-dependent receptor [Neptunicella marina]MBC3766344.1 TonB-dependent receptor [Neptunicella marina]
MFKLSSIAIVVATVFPATAFAQSLEGQVVNSKGQIVAGATVSIKGTSVETTTDSKGHFVLNELSQGAAEIHVSAKGYAHKSFDAVVPASGSQDVTLTLKSTPIEVVDVTASPFHASTIESAIPVNVLGGDELRMQQASTLGDSLENLVGVQTSFYAGVASTPIIRGLSGPRVLITQNGLDVGDASRVGPDHSVASEASTAEQIEVLRGPATLFYGSGAIGGVVNVVDQRVPTDTETRGEWLLQHQSVNNQDLASVNLNTGSGDVAFHVDGFWRQSDDYKVPGSAEIEDHDHEEEHDHEDENHVANSGEDSSGYTLGASYLLDNGYVGFSVGRLDREYGIPGHHHGGEEEHEDEDHEEEHEEEAVFADLEQNRYQLLSELNFKNSFIRSINTRAAYTDYQHAEIEDGAPSTIFKNKSSELRVDLSHQAVAGWTGGLSVHYKNSDFEAQGEEAFTPPSETKTLAMALMEEQHFGDVLVQLGARVERVELESNAVSLPELELHNADEDHDEEEHEEHEDHDHEHADLFGYSKSFNPVSLSAGLVWDFAPGYNLGVSLSRSQRAPSSSEVLSFGPHIGAGTYEVGALFELHNEGEESHLDLADHDLELETANNIDLTLRKTEGDFGFILNAFYNRVDNYYYQSPTGFVAEFEHEHEEEGVEEEHEEHEHEHADLPVYVFHSEDAILHGFEAQFIWQATDSVKTTLFSDYVRARLVDGGDLPRTPPLRFGTKIAYEGQNISANLNVTRYQKQDKVETLETATDGYIMLDATISYHLPIDAQEIVFYLKGQNLTNTEARVHTSFLKDIAPRPGRSIAAGVRGYF